MRTPVMQTNMDELAHVFRFVQDSSPEGFTLCTPVFDDDQRVIDFIYVYVNPAGASMVDLVPADLIGERMSLKFPGVVASGILAGYATAFETGEPWSHELWYDHLGVEIGFRLVAVRSANTVAVSYSDITSRLLAERERDLLLTRTSQLQAVTGELATAVDEAAVAQIAADSVRRYANARYVSILVTDATDAPLRFLAATDFPPSIQARLVQLPVATMWPAPTAFRTGIPVLVTDPVDMLQRFPDAADIASDLGVGATVSVPLRRNGVMFGVMAVDFGEPHSRQDLESRLPLLTAIADQCTLALDRARLIKRERMARSDVEVALNAADRASQDKSTFLAEVSHEVRTPLQSISAYAMLLLHDTMEPLSERQRETLQRMQQGTERIRRLVDDVLDFSQLASGKLALRAESVCLREAVQSAEFIVAPHLAAAQLTFSIEDDVGPDTFALADAHRVQQVLLNLLTNAIKHTGAGGRIILRIRNGVALADGAEVMLVEVQDSGEGIPADQLETIFEPFVQLSTEDGTHTSRRKSAPGVGLGLTISRQLARRMWGNLEAASVLDHGALFTLTLPRMKRT
ncbi:MAG: GAF domain-containing protein [Gemmatimonadaceae bacterium]|nr:GAF domain-containing protein [Gemmatimonadaceae bacterium]